MNNIRIVRWTIACLIVFTAYAFIFGTGIASAETGNITVTSQSILSYTINDGSGTAGSVMNQIYLDTTNYNDWESFHINLSLQSPTFALDSETSQFTVSGGGTGAGYVWYVKETQKLYYAFTSLTVTSSPITLSYTKNIVANITGMTRLKNDCSPSITQPILLYKETVGTPRCLGGLYESVTVDSTTTDHYNVTYPFANAFTLNVTKGKEVNDRWVVYDVDGNIYMTGTMDMLDFVLTNDSYNGIIANVSLSTGDYTIVNINVTGYPGFVTPITPTINPLTGVGITFDASSYNIGGTANISWIRNNPTPFGYQDDIYLIQPGNIKKILVSSPGNSGYVKTNDFPIAGEYNVSFERSVLGLFIDVLATDTATVSSAQPSYILTPPTAKVNENFNITYFFGYNPGTNGIEIRFNRLDTDGFYHLVRTITTDQNDVALVSETESNVTLSQWLAGDYIIQLCDSIKNECVANTSLFIGYGAGNNTAFNFTSPYINILNLKDLYLFGNFLEFEYRVDNLNISRYAITFVVHNFDDGINYTTDLLPVDYDTAGGETGVWLNAGHYGSGNNTLYILATNSTESIVLANSQNFTLGYVDVNGYGLRLSKDAICPTETTIVSVSTLNPAYVNFTYSEKEYVYKTFRVNSSMSFTYRFPSGMKPNVYYVRLQDTNGFDIVVLPLELKSGCDAALTTTPTTQAKAQNDVALLLTSPFIWALMITVGLMIATAIEIRSRDASPIIPMAVVGFLSLAAFTWLTWIPAVVFWSIVLLLAVIFAWQRSKDMNTAGD